MEEFKWIKMSLFLIPLLHFTAAARNHLLSVTVRAGDDVTLPCEHVIDGQRKCDSTTWLFSGSGNAVALFEHGQIKEEARVKSDRLSVTEKCSLVIKKVTEEDVGRYTCRQFRSGQHQQGLDTMVDLSVNSGDTKTTKPTTTATTTTTTTTKPTTTATATTTTTTKPTTTDTTTPESTPTTESSIKGWWRWLIVVFVAVAALLIITVAVIRWKRAKGNKTPTYENMADPEGGVSYASISYTKKTNRRVQARGGDDDEDDDEDDALTYSTVKAPSSSAAAAASADLSNLYATINEPKK